MVVLNELDGWCSLGVPTWEQVTLAPGAVAELFEPHQSLDAGAVDGTRAQQMHTEALTVALSDAPLGLESLYQW